MSNPAIWYLTRATGVISLVLLSAAIILGVVCTARVASERWPRIVTSGLHKNLALTALGLVVVHVTTVTVDPYVPISVAAAFIPFTASYRPIWLSLGAVAFDLMLAVVITSLLRDRLSYRFWRVMHFLVYLCWPVALLHALGIGTDTRLNWVTAIDILCVLAVAAAIWWRLNLTGDRRKVVLGLVTIAALAILMLIFAITGPLQANWSMRAGMRAPAVVVRVHSRAVVRSL